MLVIIFAFNSLLCDGQIPQKQAFHTFLSENVLHIYQWFLQQAKTVSSYLHISLLHTKLNLTTSDPYSQRGETWLVALNTHRVDVLSTFVIPFFCF